MLCQLLYKNCCASQYICYFVCVWLCLDRPRPCCFNCGSEDHQLRDCPEVIVLIIMQNTLTLLSYFFLNDLKSHFDSFKHSLPFKPKDMAKINEKRKEFSQNSSLGNQRYHAEEVEERFAKYKPGIVRSAVFLFYLCSERQRTEIQGLL